jgi:hypothetical protein
MRAEVTPEMREQLWTVREIQPEEVRAALAAAEVSLALRSVMATESSDYVKTRLTEDDFVVNDQRRVPATYFKERIARRTGVVSASAGLWAGILSTLAEGKIGLPGLHVADASGQTLWLTRAEDMAD